LLKLWEEKAKKGDVEATYELAKLYDTGLLGVEPDITRALELYRQSADQGHVGAMADLGILYVSGVNGVGDVDMVSAHSTRWCGSSYN